MTRRRRRTVGLLAATAAVATVLTSCTSAGTGTGSAAVPGPSGSNRSTATSGDTTEPAPDPATGLAGMPARTDPRNVYAADAANQLAPAVAHDLYRVYVPNSGSDTVTVIDPLTFRVLDTLPVGRQPQHVVPSYDLRTLWVNNDLGNSLTPIDPRTAATGRRVTVDDPYNLYFTPDGLHAVVMASARHRLDFRDPATMALQKSVPVPCAGVNHADWTADGRSFLVSCEFSAQLLWVDTAAQRVVRVLALPAGSMPQDVKLSPDGTRFYVADMMAGGIWVYAVTATGPSRRAFIRTGSGAHGLYVSRDARRLFVSNRTAGTVSVLGFDGDRVVATWRIPGPASPDMGNLSPDGRTLWLSGRFQNEVYALDTTTGRLRARIHVGRQPHGLTVWPQPGRYSLGHTGILR